MLTSERKHNSKVSEAYKVLRTNFQYLCLKKDINVIVITSPEHKDGKTSICGNLGLYISQINKNVMIIDCDFRNPTIHDKFNITNESGLFEVLSKKQSLNNTVKKYNSKLHILTTGKVPMNPSEILCSNELNNLLDNIKINYDVILIDTPSLEEFTDAQVLAAKADGVILVSRIRKTKKKNIGEAIQKLENVNANIIGSVLNEF